jgi:putative ABC transport system permease protein
MLRVALRGFAAHKGRMLLSAAAIVLGVAFVSGTLIFTDTIGAVLDRVFTAAAPDVTVAPQLAFTPEIEDQGLSGEVATLPPAIVATVAAVPGVRAAHGQVSLSTLTVVDATNKPVGPTSGAPTVGQNWFDSDHPLARLTQGHAPAGTGEVVVDEASARRGHLRLGDPLRVLTATGSTPATVVGIARFTTANPGIGLVFFDTPAIQRLLGRGDAYTAIAVDAAPGTADTVLRQRIRGALGAGYSIATRSEQARTSSQQIAAVLDVVTYALLGFAAVAVLVGIFGILNTFSMLVAARTRELGLLRAVGADRRQVTATVVVEALLLGLVGATVGLAAGAGLALALIHLVARFGVDLSGTRLVISPTTPAAAYAVGVVVTLIAAYLPARRAARIAPMAALREAAAPPAKPLRRRITIGLLLLAAGAAALGTASVRHDLILGGALLGAGILASLLALIVLAPAVIRLVAHTAGAGYPLMFRTVGRLSQRNTVRNPRRTGATAAALMIGVALVAALAVVAASLTTSINREVAATFGADYVLTGGSQPLGGEVTAKVRAVPGIAAVTRQRYALAWYNGLQIAISGVDVATIDQAVKTQYLAGSTADIAAGGLMVDQTTATLNDLHLGSPVPVRMNNGTTATLRVAAISKPPAGGGKDGGVFQVSLDTLTRYAPTAQDLTLYITTAPGADRAAVGRALEHLAAGYPQARLQTQADYRRQATGQVNTVLYLLYALLALAVIIAILGVINTLALSVIERTREIGLLRAVGATRPQIRRLIRLESVLVATHGAALGLGLGLAWGTAGQHLLTAVGITTLTIPWTTIAAVLAGAVAVGLAAAILPAFRAARLNTLAAITVD